jgi:hypothetical protein
MRGDAVGVADDHLAQVPITAIDAAGRRSAPRTIRSRVAGR